MVSSTESPSYVAPARRQRRWYAIWLKAVTRPSVANFRDLLLEPNASFRQALKWVLLASVAAGLVSWAIEPGFLRIDRASGLANWFIGIDLPIPVSGITTFMFFVFLEHVVARALGGQGSYAQFAFISATYTTLLILISGLLSGVDHSIIGMISSAQEATPGVSVVTSIGNSVAWFWVSQLLLLVRFAFDRVALRAVYQLGPWESFLPALVCIMVLAGKVFGPFLISLM